MNTFRITILVAAFAAIAFSQEASKPAPTPVAAPVVAPERPLTELELEKIKRTTVQIQLLNATYKMDEYQKAVEPISAEQRAVVVAACKSIGIADDKIQTDCGVNIGMGADGKQLTNPDGTPVKARVWLIEKPPANK